MGSVPTEQSGGKSPVAEPGIPVETEYLDLDDDGVPDAVQITETVQYERGGADLVEKIRELDTGIGADGVPTTVTVTDTVTIDTDHDGVPDATDVTTLTVHPAAESDAH
jgi:hypothetical protein